MTLSLQSLNLSLRLLPFNVAVVKVAVEVVENEAAAEEEVALKIKIHRLKILSQTDQGGPSILTFLQESGRAAGCTSSTGSLHTFVQLQRRARGRTSSPPGQPNEAPASSVTINHRILI